MALIRYVPPDRHPEHEHRRELSDAINQVSRMLAPVKVTVAAGTTSTVVENERISANTVPIPVPLDDSASTLTFWVAERKNGQLTLAHTLASAEADLELLLIG